MMLFFMFVTSLFYLSNVDGKLYQGNDNDIYRIANAFAKKDNIKSLVIHSKKSSWKGTLKDVYKHSTIQRYVGYDKVNVDKMHSWPHTRMDKVLHIFDDENIDRLNVLLANHNSFEALATIGKQNSSSEAVWLIHVTNANESFLSNIFRYTPLRLDSQTYVITQKDNSIYNIYDIYKIDEGSDEVEVRKYAEWKKSIGLEVIEQNIWKRRSDLRGNHLSIVAAISPPFTTYLEHGCSSSKCFKGIYADTFVKLSKTMNFTFTIEHVKTFGGLKDGKWTGMIGLLKDRKKDMSASAFTMKQSRSTVVDYLPTLMVAYEQIFIGNPTEQYDWEAYILPLTHEAWIIVLVFSIFIPLIMAAIMHNWNDQFNDDGFSISSCYCLLYKSILMMGWSNTPRKVRQRISFITIVIGSMVFYYQWEAMLISYFQNPKINIPFNSLEEFLSKSDKKLYVVGGTVYEYIFRNANDPVKKKIWNERMAPYINSPDYPKAKQELLPALIEDDNMAVYGNALSQKSYSYYKSCNVIALPKKYGIKQMGFVIPKNSSLTSAFTYFINRFIENGFVARIKQLYKTEDQVCPSYRGKPLGIRKCITLLGVLLIGSAISVLWFLIELTFPKRWLKAIQGTIGHIRPDKANQLDYIEKLHKMERNQLISEILLLKRIK